MSDPQPTTTTTDAPPKREEAATSSGTLTDDDDDTPPPALVSEPSLRTKAALEASSSPTPVTFCIVVDPPDTASNFMDYNRPPEDLNSEFLMEPVNEADYDSETQACVDARTGGPTNFHEHFVTKRKKKKFTKRRGEETQTETADGSEAAAVSNVGATSAAAFVDKAKLATMRIASVDRRRDPESLSCPLSEEVVAAAATAATRGGAAKGSSVPCAGQTEAGETPSSTMPRATAAPRPATVPLQPVDPSRLFAGSHQGVPKGALSNVAVRRIACGRMPPPEWRELHMAPPEGGQEDGATPKKTATPK